VLLNRVGATDAIRPVAGFPNLHLLTGALTIEVLEGELSQQRQPERRLGAATRALNSIFDIIVLDAPSGFSLISTSALFAAERVIVPVPAEYLAIEALAHFLRWYRDLSNKRKGQATLLGILLTMVDYRAQATREIIEMLRVHNREGVFATEIPRDPRVAEAPSHGRPLVSYSRASRAALAYEQFGKELRHRLSRTSR
jgi:chromosome partitioning protein